MPLAQQALTQLDSAQEFFNRSTRNPTEEHSGVRPAPGMMTAAQQVAHAAHTIGWFIEGTFRPEGFDTDFDAHAKIVEGYASLAAARAWFDKAVAAAKATLSTKSDAELMAPIAPGPIMGGVADPWPRCSGSWTTATLDTPFAGIVKLRLTAVVDAQHGGFATSSSPVSWGSIDALFVTLTIPSG